MKTVWMSFADEERGGNLGVCIVQITEDDLREARTIIALEYPNALNGADIALAATRKAHKLKINPGGQVMSLEIDPTDVPADCFNRLMQRAELKERGLA